MGFPEDRGWIIENGGWFGRIVSDEGRGKWEAGLPCSNISCHRRRMPKDGRGVARFWTKFMGFGRRFMPYESLIEARWELLWRHCGARLDRFLWLNAFLG